MNILVTGATGFIGQHLVRRLLADGHRVSALLRPESNTETLPKNVSVLAIPSDGTRLTSLLADSSFDGIVHLATHFLASHTSDDIPALVEANIAFGTRLIDAAANAHVPWFINTSTFSTYLDENTYGPANLYSATKKAFEDVVQYYARAGHIHALTLLLFNTFGQNDTRKKIFTLWKQAIDTQTAVDMSPGEQIIDITHIDNVVDGFSHAIEMLSRDTDKALNGKTFSLPSTERMQLKDLGSLFFEILEQPLLAKFGAQPYRPNEIMEPITGTPLPGWKPRVTLKEGIIRTFA